MTSRELSYKKIFLFWLPLAATWLMMSMEQPYLTAFIGRLGEIKYNLAAFGIAYSFALIAEAPVIMLMSASTALVKGKISYLKMKKFTLILCLLVTLMIILVVIPPIFSFIAKNLLGLPIEVEKLTYKAVLLLIPWAGAIGIRRFYQGVLIRGYKTRRVAYGTFFRLSFMSVSALVLYYFKISGALLGATSLSVGVICEAVVSVLMAQDEIKKLKKKEEGEEEIKSLGYFNIWKFYYPLALTTILSLGVQPFIVLFMGKSPFPIESLATLPVINALVFPFRSLGLAYQDVYIALNKNDFNRHKILSLYAFYLGIFVSVTLVIIAFTPLSGLWFKHVSKLTPELLSFTVIPLMILSIFPGFSVLQSYQRSVLLSNKVTAPISKAMIIEVLMIFFSLFISWKIKAVPGVTSAALAMLLGRLSANTYLFIKERKVIKNRFAL